MNDTSHDSVEPLPKGCVAATLIAAIALIISTIIVGLIVGPNPTEN